MALFEVCAHCGAVIGGRAFWSFVDPGNRDYYARCPLCGTPSPWRKATREEIDAFRNRARKVQRRAAASPGTRFARAFWTLLMVALVVAMCTGGTED
jgi:hypothetical protein